MSALDEAPVTDRDPRSEAGEPTTGAALSGGPAPRTHAEKMASLFAGNMSAYGTYDAGNMSTGAGDKVEMRARTVRSPLTEALWTAHLAGERPLGVVPIREDNTCLWGVIDIDDYSLDHAALLKKTEALKLPLVMCRSKSGGAHLFLFVSEPVPAEWIRSRLEAWVAVLRLPKQPEVFPKQMRIDVTNGEVGNWLNMPYFGCGPDGDQSRRCAVKPGGLDMTLAEFLKHAEGLRASLESFEAAGATTPAADAERSGAGVAGSGAGGGGRPASDRGASRSRRDAEREIIELADEIALTPIGGDAKGEGRNSGLYRAAGRGEDLVRGAGLDRDWMQGRLADAAREAGLPDDEIETVLENARKYGQNRDKPAEDIRPPRRSRLHPVIDQMTIVEDSDPRIVRFSLEGGRAEVTMPARDAPNYTRFVSQCFEQAELAFEPMKAGEWAAMLQDATDRAVRERLPEDETPQHQFLNLLEDFLTNKYRGETPEAMLSGKPFEDPETDTFYFPLKDFRKYCDIRGLPTMTEHAMGHLCRKYLPKGSYGERQFAIKGKNVRAKSVPRSLFPPMPQAELPPRPETPI